MNSLSRMTLISLSLVVEGGLALAAWLLGWLTGVSPLKRLRLDWRDVSLGLVICIPMLLVFCACLRWPVGPLARTKQLVDKIIRPLFGSCSLLELAFLSALAGIGEEMFFRGFLQDLFVQRLGPIGGLLCASVCFGLLHPITPTYMVMATLMGTYLGWWYMDNGNLLTVIVAHGLYDFCALIVLVKWEPERSGN